MRSLLTFSIVLVLAGCGYVADPLPPAARMPAPVLDLAVVQKGDRLEISCTLPEQTTEGLPIAKPGLIDLRAGPAVRPPFNQTEWLAGTRAIDVVWPEKPATQTTPTRISTTIPATPWVDRDLVIGIRLSNPKGRFSGFSKLATITVAAPLAAPAVNARGTAEGVALTWPADPRPGVRYSVRRLEDGVAEPVALGETAAPEFLDRAAIFDKPYRYVVEAALRRNQTNALSPPSPEVPVMRVDVFPPAVPTGLTALLGVTSIEVAWDRNTESDLAGYRLYRAPAGAGAFTKIADLGIAPAYSDRQFEKGTTYRYAVAAVDRKGNESARSTPFEIEVR